MAHQIYPRKDNQAKWIPLSDGQHIYDEDDRMIFEIACSNNTPRLFKAFLGYLGLPDDDSYQIIIAVGGKIVAAQNIDFE